jgi:hypothetical protein
VLKGDRLVIDLKTGESRFENTGNTTAGGRIRALFMPRDGKPGAAAKQSDGKPRDAAPKPAPTPEASGGTSDDDVPLPLDPLQR